jgi:hypothetical protein
LVHAGGGKTPGFYIPSANEPLPGSARLLCRQTLFRPTGGDETKLGRDETIFQAGEDIRKPALGINPLTKRRAEKAQ